MTSMFRYVAALCVGLIGAPLAHAEKVDLLITNATLVTMDGSRQVIA
jgi:hypothetical protein